MASLSLNSISSTVSRLPFLSASHRKATTSALCLSRRWRSPVAIRGGAAAGPTAAASLGFSESIGETLGEVSIFSASSGEAVLIKDLWDQSEEIAVVALLRHFGCICCWELASALRDSMPKFESCGVKLIAIGVGTPDKAQILAERLPFPLDRLYADPDRTAYDTLDLYYGVARTFLNPASAKVFSRSESIKKAAKNYTTKATPNDFSSVLQQGGMFVFKGKELIYARKDEGTGDHAPLDDVLNICCNKVQVA
ncbi:hypothetical protein LUZ60_006185 [Juncus effusus]|nr:hypothetical protein LUZ60_006185 [Juncus effusus]